MKPASLHLADISKMRPERDRINAPGQLVHINEVCDGTRVGYGIGGCNKAHRRDDDFVAWPDTDSDQREMESGRTVDN